MYGYVKLGFGSCRHSILKNFTSDFSVASCLLLPILIFVVPWIYRDRTIKKYIKFFLDFPKKFPPRSI